MGGDASGVDKMSTSSHGEASLFTMNGQLYYAPKNNSASQKPLYRLLGGSDHMDSLATNEGGYSLEGTLAYPWNGACKAITEVLRIIRSFIKIGSLARISK